MNHFQEIIDRTLQEKGETHYPLVIMFFSLTLTLKPKKILELGVRNGGSTYPFLCASKLIGSHVTSVDLNPALFSCPKDLVDNWTFIRSDAISFLENNKTHYDLIYVDDWHSYPHVKREIELIDSISDQNTLILLHDLMAMHPPNYFLPISEKWNNGEWEQGGPFKAVLELDKTKWEWMTLPISHGLTLLKKIPQIATE